MKKTFQIIAISVLALGLISCGQQTQSTPARPVVDDPLNKPQQKLEVPNSGKLDPRLPDLSKAVSINLADKTTFQGLKDIAGDISLPLVGDPKISMAYTPLAKSGTILLAFEDRWGFWGANIPSFPGTGSKTASAFDMIFSDNELVVRVKGTLSGDNFADPSTIYYRVRQPGENACKVSTTTCNITDPGLNWGPFTCPYPQPDSLTPCLNYMNTSNAAVKVLGKFISKFSQWATIPEGN